MASMPRNLNVDLSDLKESCVRRLLREVVTQDMSVSKPASMRGEAKCTSCHSEPDGDEDMDDEDEESESEKLVNLQQETRGKPAPLPVTEEDFSEGTLRKAVAKVMPNGKRKAKG